MLPKLLRLAGKRLVVRYSRALPASLPKHAILLRRTNDRAGQLASRYWQTESKGRYRLDWLDAGIFDLNVREGRVTCAIYPGASPGAVEEVLRGPVCAFFLLGQGFEPLHASAVVLGGRCVAFAGAPGAGKSSLVAWLSCNGAQFVCDDILPLQERGRAVCGYPGLSQLRLEPLVARELGWRSPAGARPPSSELKEKSQFRVIPPRGPHPVAQIYLLERIRKGLKSSKPLGALNSRSRSVQTQRLAPRQAFRALLKSTRNDSLDTPERLRRQLHIFARVARTVPVSRLRYPSTFAAFPAILAHVQRDLKLTQ